MDRTVPTLLSGTHWAADDNGDGEVRWPQNHPVPDLSVWAVVDLDTGKAAAASPAAAGLRETPFPDLGDIATTIIAGEGVTKTQVLALGADVLGAVIPFATGLGAGVRVASKGDDGIRLFHGTDVDSALSFLNGAGLDAGEAAARKIDGPSGFFLATDVGDAAHFAARRGEGTVLDISFSAKALPRC